MAVSINGKVTSEFEPLLEASPGVFYASAEVFERARLAPPSATTRFQGELLYCLNAIPGVRLEVDVSEQALRISAPPHAFLAFEIESTIRPDREIERTAPGFFLNHDWQAHVEDGGTDLTGLVEAGVFSPAGVFTTDMLQRSGSGATGAVRLDTRFTRDLPNRMQTIVVGDGVTSGGLWGQQARFAGARWGSKFSTRPSQLPYALPSVAGEAAVPSVVDVYVDGVRRVHGTVDTGPFSIHQIPVISPQGDLTVVVTDAAGRQRRISQPYLAFPQLLRKGVHRFNYETGILRRDYGVGSGNYRSLFGATDHSFGLTDRATVHLRAEMAGEPAAGLGAHWGVPGVGLVGGGLALSRSTAGVGRLWHVEAAHPSRTLQLSARALVSDDRFPRLGARPGERAGRREFQAQGGRTLGDRGTISLSYVARRSIGERAAQAITTTVGLRTRGAWVNASVSRLTTVRSGWRFGVTLTLPVGTRGHVSAGADGDAKGGSARIHVEQGLPMGTGWGYRALASSGAERRAEAGLAYQNERGRYSAEVSHAGGRTAARFAESGSLVWMRGRVLRSRWLDDSFALVRVPGHSDVGVYVNHQLIANTDRDGLALLPRLVPYDRNLIELDATSIPIDSALDLLEQTVVPVARSGVFVEFEVVQGRSATLILVDEGGEPIPVGAEVRIGSQAALEVGLRGEVYAPELEAPTEVLVKYADRTCRVEVDSAPDEPLPRIGPLVCREVER